MAKQKACNMCGREFDMWDAQEDFTIERYLGYGTKYDGERLSLHLCCFCMEKIIDACEISPILLLPTKGE